MFIGHEGFAIVLVLFKNSFFYDLPDDFWITLGFFNQIKDESVSDAARRRPFAVVNVDIGRAASVPLSGVD